MVHDAIAYAPYELQFINQTYTAYELLNHFLLRIQHSKKFSFFSFPNSVWECLPRRSASNS